MTYTVIRKAKCDRCGHEYDSSNPTRHEFLTDWLEIDSNGIDEYDGYRQTHHLCRECRQDAQAFMGNESVPPARKGEDGEPLALWERELLAPVTRDDLLDELVDLLYPLDEYRDSQWDGGDICEALARIVDRERPEAKTRQPEEPSITPRYCLTPLWLTDDVQALCALPLGHGGPHAHGSGVPS
jgi:hypothetical protein